MEWRDVWMMHAGSPVAVLGCGWSLPHAVVNPRWPCIAVNDARHSGHRVDYWVALDQGHVRSATKNPSGVADAVWVIRRRYSAGIENALVIESGPIDRRRCHLPPESICEEFIDRGTFPGQRQRVPKPKPGRVWLAHSSVNVGIHLALLMGASEVHLFGVDLGNDPMTGVRRFCDDDVPAARKKAVDRARQLVDHRHDLESMGALWVGDPRDLVIHSPSGAAKWMRHWRQEWP